VNKIYTQQGFSIKQEFTSTLQKYYGAEATQVNFADSTASAKLINDFVSTATKDKIKDLISAGDLDAMTRLVLVNAIYFKGMWKNKFDPAMTREADFHLTAKEKVKVQMMRMETEIPYADIDELDAKAVALPYKVRKLQILNDRGSKL
jgi:serpin B